MQSMLGILIEHNLNNICADMLNIPPTNNHFRRLLLYVTPRVCIEKVGNIRRIDSASATLSV